MGVKMKTLWALGLAASALLGAIFGALLASSAQAASLPAPAVYDLQRAGGT